MARTSTSFLSPLGLLSSISSSVGLGGNMATGGGGAAGTGPGGAWGRDVVDDEGWLTGGGLISFSTVMTTSGLFCAEKEEILIKLMK